MADTVSVASSIYNLAGNESERPNYLKSLLMGCIIQEVDSVGRTLVDGYLKGPALKFRNFLKWSRKDPSFINTVGIVTGNLHSIHYGLDYEVIRRNIPVTPPEYVDHIETAFIEPSNLTFWVQKYLCENNPQSEPANAGFWGPYSYKYNKDLDVIEATFYERLDGLGNPTTIGIPIDQPLFEAGADYLYVKYQPGVLNEDELPQYGPFQAGWKNVDGYTENRGWQVTGDQSLANLKYKETWTVTHKRPDGTDVIDPETTVTETEKLTTVDNRSIEYFQDTYKGKHLTKPNTVYSERHWLEVEVKYKASEIWGMDPAQTATQTYDLPGIGTVIKQTHFTREYQTLQPDYWYREDRKNVIHKEWKDPLYFIYRRNSGNQELDGLFNRGASNLESAFYPPIPFRYDNLPVGREGLGSKEWLVYLGVPFFENSQHELQIVGGGATESDPIVAERSEGATPGWGWFTIVSRDGRPLGPALQTPGARFRLVTYGSPSIFSDWVKFEHKPEPLGDDTLDELYPTCKKAFRKAFGASFDQVQEQILRNKSIEDIDHAYAVFGVSLNVKENACRKYIFKFMEYLKATGEHLEEGFEQDWYEDWYAAKRTETTWNKWHREGQRDDNGDLTEPPPKPKFPEVPWQTLRVEAVKDGVSDYRTEIKWAFISEDSGIGVLDVPKLDGSFDHKAEPDELWFENLSQPLPEYREADKENPDGFNQRVRLNWQVSENTYKQLTITGLQHINYVYRNMKTVTTAYEALLPTAIIVILPPSITYRDGPESPFLVPLNELVYDEMSMVDRTQMATACCFLVFNCYAIDKQEWYETDWFKVVLIAVLIIAAVATALATGGASLGYAGATVIGLLTGAGIGTTAAIIMATLLLTLAGMALSWLITKASIEAFGEKWGPLISAIITTVLSMGLSAGDLSKALEVLGSSAGLMALGQATISGISTYMEVTAAEIRADTAQMMESYNTKNAEIQRLFNEEFGRSTIDPSLVNKYISEVTEKSEQFLQRTLMTGSDIVEITLGYVENFVQDRLRLEMP